MTGTGIDGVGAEVGTNIVEAVEEILSEGEDRLTFMGWSA